jgi:hypothetical protein
MITRRDEHEMPGIADGSEALGDDVAGHLVDAGEEPCVVVPCLLGSLNCSGDNLRTVQPGAHAP